MIEQKLRPYQVEIARAVLTSIMNRTGLTFTVEIARQGGKNELSAQLEVLLLTLFMARGGNLVKCSPTFKPQTVNSMLRLKERLDNAGLRDYWQSEMGYMVRLGNARAIFFSADGAANVVGATAHILLEADEAQDIDAAKFDKEFRPMGSTTNCTTVLYGTAWDDSTLLERTKQVNLEQERRDGIRRHFEYDWQIIARYNPSYARYVESERERLGHDHPLFKTQYCLQTITGDSGFLSTSQRAQMRGEHQRRVLGAGCWVLGDDDRGPGFGSQGPIPQHPAPNTQHPAPNTQHPAPNTQHPIYVAGIDLAGEDEEAEDDALRALKPRRDSTVMTVAALEFPDPVTKEPLIRIVNHYWWTGTKHQALYQQLLDLLKNVWRVRRVVVDATGVGAAVASFLGTTLGSVVEKVVFTQQSKSALGFEMLAAVNGGRLKMYAWDDSPESREFWFEMEKAKTLVRPNQTLSFYVDPAIGHDDFLISTALVVRAAGLYRPKTARGRIG